MRKILAATLVLFLFAGFAHAAKTTKKAKKITQKGNVAIVISQADFSETEYFTVKKALNKAGYTTVTASNVKKVKLDLPDGKSVRPDMRIDEIDYSSGYDAIVVIGGSGAEENLWNNTQLLRVVNNFYLNGKVTAAIDQAPVVLAQAGTLNGMKASVSSEANGPGVLTAAGAVYAGKGVVTSGLSVTAAGQKDASRFAKAIISLMKKNSKHGGTAK